MTSSDWDAVRLFADYLRVTGVAHIDPEPAGDPALRGKRLGVLNGSSWITLWSNLFGHRYLPGVHLINVGNEAVQINFMEAHAQGQPAPPQSNIDTFTRYARDLVELAHVNAVLITCSTMNRAYPAVQQALKPYGVPVVQIDRPMMERAVKRGGRVLVVATHGPTVASTQALLRETADASAQAVSFCGITVAEAWRRLAVGDVEGHNAALSAAIRAKLAEEPGIDCVVLAQLSMTVLLLSYPDPVVEFGVPILTSGQCGFEYVRSLLTG
ncbi:MAG: aspartate/glutamate racemase family protein [Chloroflexales bacterium]|nr:aspartate/glutamate racemase family protein [Chloroflexales bacterium]